jgi:hypothetical protein
MNLDGFGPKCLIHGQEVALMEWFLIEVQACKVGFAAMVDYFRN